MTLAIAAGLWLAGQCAVADDLAALVKQAQDNFQPISTEQLAAAHADLVKQADKLQRYLGPGSSNGQSWNSYLKWDNLKPQLASAEPQDLAPLAATYRLLNADYNGLELAPFRRVSAALRHYLDLAVAARSGHAQQVYEQQLDALATELDQYAQQPNPELAFSISQRLDFIAGLGQTPELVAAVRQQYAQPNAFVTVTASLLDKAAAADPIDRTDPVTDVILGTNIYGTSQTTGTLSVATVPGDDRATLELTSTGHTESQNRGYKGPAVIRSTGHTDFTATMRVELSDKQFVVDADQVDATTNSDIHSVGKKGGGFGSKLVSRIGWDKVQENHACADSIASSHAEDRIRRRMYDEVSEKLRSARDRYENDYRAPLARRGELPDQIAFSTTDDAMELRVTQANRAQLAAPGAPPSSPGGQDLVMRVHESAVNNYAAAVLGGVTASETAPGQETQFNSPLPEWLKKALEDRSDAPAGDAADQEPFKPWSLTFRRGRAISVAFAGDQVELTIHMARLTSGDDEFADWDVSGTFKTELKDGGVVLHRQGDLVVLPTGFDREHGTLSSRQVAVRSNLTKVLNQRSAQGRGFPATITIDALEPSGDLSKVGPLWAGQFTSDGGWLTMAWNRQ